MEPDLMAAMEQLHLARRDIIAAREHITAATVLRQQQFQNSQWVWDAIKLIEASEASLFAARKSLLGE